MSLPKYLKNNLKEETCSAQAAHVSVLKRSSGSKGQTLIETVVAIFILVMGISTAIGLAIYSFQNTDSATKAIVGTSLAREAIEAVKNKRDSNWITDNNAGGLSESNCIFATSEIGQPCDDNWAAGLASGNYAIDVNAQDGSEGVLQDVLTLAPASYQLLYCPTSGGSAGGSFISSTSGAPSCVGAQTTIYSRKVTLTLENTDPSDPTSGQTFSFSDGADTFPALLDVVSTVWWQSRRCPQTTDPTTLPNSCKVVLETHLLNWRKLFE
jgi:type II secretory pathway pseudopilin PulG